MQIVVYTSIFCNSGGDRAVFKNPVFQYVMYIYTHNSKTQQDLVVHTGCL